MGSVRDEMNNLARDYAIAWSSGDAEAVAAFFTDDGQISVNGGAPENGRAAIAEFARRFRDEFSDFELRCDMMRWAGTHAIFVWTLEGHHAKSGNHVVTRGWEEWELAPDQKIISSQDWFDAQDHQRQIDGI
ncbi:nuclear transport factor 2 family protein [Ruegeria sp.]|uniref:nuclear transport factor 2 family protein n=1 Tax=Ruegeria sp. TaxID=1879320 RepID=UPI003C79BE9A